MSEKIIVEKIEEKPVAPKEVVHRPASETETNPDGDVATTQMVEVEKTGPKNRSYFAWLIAASLIGLALFFGLLFIWSKRSATKNSEVSVSAEKDEKKSEEKGEGNAKEIKLDPETLESAGIETEGVTQRPAVALLKVTGTIESNPQQTQQVSPLVGGRIEEVYVSIGDHVTAGQTLATIMSTEIVESYGKLREAQNRLELAQRNLDRVKRAENQVNILQAKAKLDEAEATLKRTKRLIELGAGAGKDLISAETNYKTAKADYDFQRNIPLNREIQEAEGARKTAEIEAMQQRQSLEALGIAVGSGKADARTVALVQLRAPLTGIVTERMVAPGAGIQAGQAIFTLSNISSLWVTANVPEQQMSMIRIGTPAEVHSPALGEKINARVTYIDPQISEDTRTARVRLAVPNPGERLRAGMFAEVGFQTSTGATTGEELVVPTTAIQRIGEKTVVFVPEEGEAGSFKVREVETGGEIEGYTRIKSGLELGEKVVTKGSFTLKTQLQKGEMGDDDDS